MSSNSKMYTNPEELIEFLQIELKNRPRTMEFSHIAKATKVDLDWIKKFTHNGYKNPCFVKVSRLHIFLIGNSFNFEESP